MTNNVTEVEYLKLPVSIIRTPHIDVAPSLWVDNAPNKMCKIIKEIETLDPTHMLREQKTKSRKVRLEMGTHEERNYALAPTFQPSIMNHQHSSSSQDVGSLHRLENFEEPSQILLGTRKAKHNAQTHQEHLS